MSMNLAWRVVALGVMILCAGCGTTGGSSSSCDTCSTARCAPESEAAAATRDRLLRKQSLSGEEKLALADAFVVLGNLTAAETQYFGALSRGGLSDDQQFRAQMGLARVADAQGQRYSARTRYAQAWKLGPTPAAKDNALIALTLVEIADGELTKARDHRNAVADATRPELAEIDRKLGAEQLVAVTSKGQAAAGAPRGRGLAPPRINGRETWRASPMAMKGNPEPMGRITRVTLHHTADERAVGTSYASVAERVKAYQTGHQQTNRWADIGYHFIVDQAGRVWEGRKLSWQGAHAGNGEANANNVGIALIGNFEDELPTPAQVNATEELLVWISLEYGVPSSKIYTHSEVERMYGIKGVTCCPGRRFGPTLAKLKRGVDEAQRGGARAAMHD